MSASTAHTRTLPVEASIGRLVMNADYDASGSTDHHDENEGDPDCHTDIVHLWLQQMSPPELQSLQRDPDVEAGSGSSSSCHTFDNDDRVVIALGDLLVADDLGNIGTSRRDLANLLDAHDNNNALEYVGTSGARAEESSTEGGDGDGHENESTQDEDEDLMLQHCILESMASAKHENLQWHHIEDDRRLSAPPADSADVKVNNPAVAVLTLNWADIELDDDEKEESSVESNSSESGRRALKPCSTSIDSVRDKNVFECPWTAWYDPPKGRTARMGIASDAYEKKLFEMGVIQSPDDFWAVHDMVDWNNMPGGSMISFSRTGAKPFWEDPIHCCGGRWIIRGFPRSKSESLFTKVALSLFLGYFPETYEFTCITLQVKEKRRSNTIQLWTRSLGYDHIDEIQEHICCLVDGWESDDERQSLQAPRAGRRKRGKTVQRHPSPPRRLHFEFCPNSESIERNAVKLGDIAPIELGRRAKRNHKAIEVSLASRCSEVAEMYSAGRNRRKEKKKGKVDWSDTLLAMGYGKHRGSRGFIFGGGSSSDRFRHESSIFIITPKGTPVVSDIGDVLTPEKSQCQSSSSPSFNLEDAELDTNLAVSSRSSSLKKDSMEDNWRRGSSKSSGAPRSCRGAKSRRKVASYYHDKTDNNDQDELSFAFVGTDDLECLEANGEEPAFVEFDPRLVGLDCWWSYCHNNGDECNDFQLDHYRLEQQEWATEGPCYYRDSFMSIEPSCGSFDSHGCWYPPTSTTIHGDNNDQPEKDCVSKLTHLSFPSITTIDTMRATDEGDINGCGEPDQGGDSHVVKCDDYSNDDENKSWSHFRCSAVDASDDGSVRCSYPASDVQQQWGVQYSVPLSRHPIYNSTVLLGSAHPDDDSYCYQPYYQGCDQIYYPSQHSSEISRLADSVTDQNNKA